MNSPCLSAAGVRFLGILWTLWDWPVLTIGLLENSRPHRGCHVPHRQETLGELASLRREPGTISGEPLISPDPHSSKDSQRPTTHVPFCTTTLRPRLHSCSTRHQLFLAEISTVAVYFGPPVAQGQKLAVE